MVGDLNQLGGIGEEQRGALVGGGAAGKAQREHLGIERQAGALGYLGEQRRLVAGVSGENLLLGQVDGVAQIEIVAPPRGNVLVQHLSGTARRPRWARERRW